MEGYPNKSIRLLMHSLGIDYLPNGRYNQANTRYSPYPTTYRNHFQTEKSEQPDEFTELERKGYVKYIEHKESWRCFYYVTEKGKQYLKDLGYKWH